MAARIEVLGRQHRALAAGFESQHASLVEYLKRYALRHAEKDLLARTFVAIDEAEGRDRLAGYFSLTTTSVERSAVAGIAALDRLPRFPIPAVLLARLAVDSRVQGQGVGRFLFERALEMTLGLTVRGPVSFRLLVADAIDARAVRFYEHFGLVRVTSGPDHPARMVLDLLPLASGIGIDNR